MVRALHRNYIKHNLNAYTVYLSGNPEGLRDEEIILGVNARSPLNLFRIRKLFKHFSNTANEKIIVHVHLTWPFLYAALATLCLPNIKMIYTEHSTTNKRRRIPLFWTLERLVYKRYDRIICISQGVNDSLAKWVGPSIASRLVTIPNGSRIYSLIERRSLDKRLPKLISVGSLSSRKNFVTAIRAIARLRTEIDIYTIVGDGPERAKLEEIIQGEGLSGKVQLIGWSEDIETHLHAADIQLIPSLWEGFGLVAVEGMSTGLSVVASKVDGMREVVGEATPSVTLVDQPDSVDEWVSAIRTSVLRIHSQGMQRLAWASRQQAEKFTLDEMAERYLDVYRQVSCD